MADLTLLSPAKINLFLKIVSKRNDGYHNLYSLFKTVSLFDRLTIKLSKEDRITTNNSELPCDGRNLALKAAYLFAKNYGKPIPVDIHIEKNIPMEAGLGGGSSNAATVLFGLNELLMRPFSNDQLKEMGSHLGADVAFFFSKGCAICKEKGDVFQDFHLIESPEITLVKPHYGLKTPDVYKAFQLQQTTSPSLAEIENELHLKKIPFFNDLEKPAFFLKPELQNLKENLKESGFEAVLMSGSGSSFICLGEGSLLDRELWRVKCSFISRSENGWY